MSGPSKFPVLLYLGPPGTGKTELMRKHIRPFVKSKRSVIIANDPEGQFEEYGFYTIAPIDWAKVDWDGWPDDTIFVLDEVQLICPSSAGETNHIRMLLNFGRGRGFRIFATSRRPTAINIELTAFASTVFGFRTTHPRDLKWFRDAFGPDFADAIAEAPQFQPVVWNR